MANTIKIKNSGTASAVPSSLEYGELGINYADGKIYYKNASEAIVEFLNARNLDSISDVVITDPQEFQTLEYNGTNWINTFSQSAVLVRNDEATTMTTGTVVYVSGSTGDHAKVKRADNDSDTTSATILGVTGANITSGANGPVITLGYIDGLDLSVGYTAGDILWLGENGGFTTTKPTAPEHLVFIGIVVRATNNGIIFVAPQNGYELDELHNVLISNTLASGDFLKYNGTVWINDPINLGTDTVGNYVSSLVSGTGVSLANNSGEGATPTISIGQAVGTTDYVTFGNLTIESIDTPGSINIYTSTSGTPGEGNVYLFGSMEISNDLRFTGSSYVTTISIVEPTENRSISIPNSNGTLSVSEVSFSQQTTSYTLALSDKDKMVEMNVGSANNLTVPADNTVNFPVGTSIDILQVGSGQTTIVAASGVTINRATGLKLRAQWSAATLIKRAANTWVAVGDLSA